MKKLLLAGIVVLALYWGSNPDGPRLPEMPGIPARTSSDETLKTAFDRRQSSLQVEGQGTVIRILPDDNSGSRHQRFILELGSGQTLLISHNIDLAPRVTGLQVGNSVEFYGEYEWNEQGGVIHWTHRDPAGRHPAGFIRHGGRTYQ